MCLCVGVRVASGPRDRCSVFVLRMSVSVEVEISDWRGG